MKTGSELIAEERERQISQEGWTPEHDDGHKRSEIATAGISYALAAVNQGYGLDHKNIKAFIQSMHWPEDWGDFKMSDSPIRNFVKAGALIAAEIDRLQRARGEGERVAV